MIYITLVYIYNYGYLQRYSVTDICVNIYPNVLANKSFNFSCKFALGDGCISACQLGG